MNGSQPSSISTSRPSAAVPNRSAGDAGVAVSEALADTAGDVESDGVAGPDRNAPPTRRPKATAVTTKPSIVSNG